MVGADSGDVVAVVEDGGEVVIAVVDDGGEVVVVAVVDDGGEVVVADAGGDHSGEVGAGEFVVGGDPGGTSGDGGEDSGKKQMAMAMLM